MMKKLLVLVSLFFYCVQAQADIYDITSSIERASILLGANPLEKSQTEHTIEFTGIADIDVVGDGYTVNSATITINGAMELFAAVDIGVEYVNVQGDYTGDGFIWDRGFVAVDVNLNGEIDFQDLSEAPIPALSSTLIGGLPISGIQIAHIDDVVQNIPGEIIGGTINEDGDIVVKLPGVESDDFFKTVRTTPRAPSSLSLFAIRSRFAA